MSNKLLNVVVSAITPSGRDNLLFELRAADNSPLPVFEAGAHIDVYLKNGLVRQYSLCGPVTQLSAAQAAPDHYLLCVHLDKQSRGGSAAMHGNLTQGDHLQISHPRNNFSLPQAQKYLLFAGGIGITPMLPLAETAHAAGAAFELHYYTTHAEQKALTERLHQLNIVGNIFFHESHTGNSLRDKLPASLQKPDSQTVIMMCGPVGFMQHLKNSAETLGWEKSQLYSEQFQNDAVTETRKDTFAVQVASTGAIYQIGKNDTIAEVLTANGVSIDLSCEQGMCGACLTKVLSGIPEHHDIVQSDAEKELNTYMTVCCSRSMSDLLVLDL